MKLERSEKIMIGAGAAFLGSCLLVSVASTIRLKGSACVVSTTVWQAAQAAENLAQGSMLRGQLDRLARQCDDEVRVRYKDGRMESWAAIRMDIDPPRGTYR